MSQDIHPTAIVSDLAQIGEGVRIGPYSRVERGVVIGAGCVLESHVFIDRNTTLGKDNFLGHGVVLGTPPQDKKFDPESKTGLVVGNNNSFREYCTVNRATGRDANTVIGSGNLFMTTCHIGHNCHVGNETVLSNFAMLAGHVEVQDWAIIGGMVPIPQFTRIGKASYLGGFSAIRLDLPPYFRAAGFPGGPAGINRVGMERRGIPEENIRAVHLAYKALYLSKLTQDQALEKIEREFGQFEEIRFLVQFIRESKHGILRPRSDRGQD